MVNAEQLMIDKSLNEVERAEADQYRSYNNFVDQYRCCR